MSAIGKFISIFGKDIIQEPLRLIDRQLQVWNARVDKEHEQRLQQEQRAFFVELDARERKMNEEIEQMIDDRELERQSKIMKSIERYQIEMAECSASIANSLGLMNIELRDKAHAMVQKRKKDYEIMQENALNNTNEQLVKISNQFPEGSNARRIMEGAVEKQINGIIENSIKFIQMIDDDFAKMMDSIAQITQQSTLNINQYLSPALAKAVEKKIEGRNQLAKLE